MQVIQTPESCIAEGQALWQAAACFGHTMLEKIERTRERKRMLYVQYYT